MQRDLGRLGDSIQFFEHLNSKLKGGYLDFSHLTELKKRMSLKFT